mgnify:CR=1 FL=1|tara:strand:- start:641 stop:1651 length:1011 start_codon:yes stop_codon:yes gene_type:complete
MKKNINVGIIGTGYGDYVLLEALNKLNFVNQKIIYGRNKSKLKKILSTKRANKITSSLKIFLKNKLSLICIATIPSIQYKILDKININNYKFFFLEKPIANNFCNTKKIYEKFKKIKSKVAVDFMFLGLQPFLEFKKVIKNQKISSVRIKWHFKAYHYKRNILKTWKKNKSQGGGIYFFFLIHVISYINFFFGRIKKIVSKNEILDNMNKISGVNLNLVCGNNLKINLDFNSNAKKNIHKVEVFTQKNIFQVINNTKDHVKNFKILKLNNSKKIKKKILFLHKYPLSDSRVMPVIKLFKDLLLKKKPTSNIYDAFKAALDIEKIITHKNKIIKGKY